MVKWGRENSKCKDPKVEMCLAFLQIKLRIQCKILIFKGGDNFFLKGVRFIYIQPLQVSDKII